MVTHGESEIGLRAIDSAITKLDIAEILVLYPKNNYEIVDFIINGLKGRNINITFLGFEWCDDFAKARNVLLDNTKSDYVLWMDADDILCETSTEKWHSVHEVILKNSSIEVFNFRYFLYDHHGTLSVVSSRDKIFKRQGAKWIHKVHEVVFYEDIQRNRNLNVGNILGIHIEHRPNKNGLNSLIRNVKICENALLEDGDDYSKLHYKYYLAKDNWLIGYSTDELVLVEQSIKIFKEILENKIGTHACLHDCANIVASYYVDMFKSLSQVNESNNKELYLSKAETYFRIALSYFPKNPLTYHCLGEIYLNKSMANEAIKFANLAMSQDVNLTSATTVAINTRFYKEYPSRLLRHIYLSLKSPELELALYHNKNVLQCNPEDSEAKILRKNILDVLSKNQ